MTTLAPNLFEAVKAGRREEALDLLSQGVPATFTERARTGAEWTSLHWAACNGDLTLVDKLLEHGAADAYKNHAEHIKGLEVAMTDFLGVTWCLMCVHREMGSDLSGSPQPLPCTGRV